MARIKIKDQDRRPEFSITVVVCAAVLIWFTILLWSTRTPAAAAQRALSDIGCTYVCEDGHRFEGRLDVRSHPCAQDGCALRAWPLWSYQCSKDGAFAVQLRYTHTGRSSRIQAARPLHADWQQVRDEIHCPLCGRVLLPDLTLREVAPRAWSAPASDDAAQNKNGSTPD